MGIIVGLVIFGLLCYIQHIFDKGLPHPNWDTWTDAEKWEYVNSDREEY